MRRVVEDATSVNSTYFKFEDTRAPPTADFAKIVQIAFNTTWTGEDLDADESILIDFFIQYPAIQFVGSRDITYEGMPDKEREFIITLPLFALGKGPHMR